jgi:branched-subunit amino acid aminotransferase/4-amino-4-deoxychorismate lyase
MWTVWLNGSLLPANEARIPALDRGVLWGYGLFETLRAYDGRLWAFDEHYARLLEGARLVGIAPPEGDELRHAMVETLEANALVDAGVRATLTAGAGPPEPHADPDGPPNLLVTAWQRPDYSDLYAGGAALVTIEGARPLAEVKTTSYAASVVGRVMAERAGADDALFVVGGNALEATGSNLFCVRGSVLSTPPTSDGLLPGVTRGCVIEVAGECGFTVEERSIELDELFAADEVVLTSSMREVYPVSSVDGRDTKRGDVAETLRAAYHSAVLRSLDGA